VRKDRVQNIKGAHCASAAIDTELHFLTVDTEPALYFKWSVLSFH